MWFDIEANKHKKSYLLSILAIISIMIGIIVSVKAVNVSFSIKDKLVASLLLFILITYLVGTFSYVFNAYRMITVLKISDSGFSITNSLSKDKYHCYSDINHVYVNNKNNFYLNPHWFRPKAKGLMILSVKKTTYFISPHMERFDELKAKLTEIVEQNKKTN